MMPYQFEPYNAFSKKPVKKHWTQIAEEEALQARMIAEARAAQQTQNDSVNNGQTSAQVGTAPGQGASGGGGVPPQGFFNPNVNPSFTFSPGDLQFGPVTELISNTSVPDVIQFCNNVWTFGDGGSTFAGPFPVSHLYANTGSFTASLAATSIYDSSKTATATFAFTVLAPSVTASFTTSSATPASGSHPLTVTFVNTSINTSQTPTTTYFWDFGSGSLTSTEKNPTVTYLNSGSYQVTLQVTGSYGIAAEAASSTDYILAF